MNVSRIRKDAENVVSAYSSFNKLLFELDGAGDAEIGFPVELTWCIYITQQKTDEIDLLSAPGALDNERVMYERIRNYIKRVWWRRIATNG